MTCFSRASVVACLLLTLASAVKAGSVVDIPAGAPTEEIIAAIAKTGDGGTVRFPAGTWTVTNTLVLAKGVTVEGAGPSKTVLDFNQKCRGFELSHASARVKGLKIFRARCQGENTGVNGGGINMSDGTVTDCLVDSCSIGGTVGRIFLGGGVYMSGGRLERCGITRCTFENLYGFANALFIRGGTADGCDIYGNNGGYSHPTVAYGGAVVYLDNGVLENSKVHQNIKDSNPGVNVNGGAEVRNCLIYGNQGVHGSGGIYMGVGFSGTIDHCTVYGNLTTEKPGNAGLRCTGGTVKNSIFWANGAAGGCQVASGSKATIVNNVFDKVLGDYPDNRVADPKFADPGRGDFRIASKASPACGYAVPDGKTAKDITGFARDAKAPTCGAYEYDPSKESFGADIVFSQTAYGVGSDVGVEAVVTGAKVSDVEFIWYLDDRKLRDRGAKLNLPGLSEGRHSVGLKVAQRRGGELVIKDYTDSINVLPSECYVNMTGSETYPFDTPEKGTKSIEAAMSALWVAPNVTSVVHIAGGSYTMEKGIALQEKIRIIGEGSQVVTVFCPDHRTFWVSNDAAEIRGITVNGGQGGFEISAGRVIGCRATNVQTSRINTMGAGFKITGGEILDCEAVNCSAYGTSCGGGGLAIFGGKASNMRIENCGGFDATSGSGAVFGIGGALKNITVTGSHQSRISGSAIQAIWTELDSCVFSDCSSTEGSAVKLVGLTAKNCTFSNLSGAKCFDTTNTVFRSSSFSGCTSPSSFLGATEFIDCTGLEGK